MRKFLEIGGIVAAAVLIAFGVAAIVLSFQGQNTVSSSLKQEQITGTPDMTPQTITSEVTAAQKAQTQLFAKLNSAGAKLTPSPIETPSCSVAGKLVQNGSEARCFAQYMRIHTFGASSGLTYSQMGRYTALPSTPTQVHRRARRHQRPPVRPDRPQNTTARRQRPPRHLGHLHRPHHRPQLQLHGDPDGALRNRRRHRPPPRRTRLRDPRDRRRPPQPRNRTRLDHPPPQTHHDSRGAHVLTRLPPQDSEGRHQAAFALKRGQSETR